MILLQDVFKKRGRFPVHQPSMTYILLSRRYYFDSSHSGLWPDDYTKTDLSLHKTAAISHTIFLDSFSWMKISYFN